MGPPVHLWFTTSDDRTRNLTGPTHTSARELDADSLRLVAGNGDWYSVLALDGDAGTFLYQLDLGGFTGGYLASMTRVADDSAFPAPSRARSPWVASGDYWPSATPGGQA